MNLGLLIFVSSIALTLLFVASVGWRMFKRKFNDVVNHFEEDEGIARGHGL